MQKPAATNAILEKEFLFIIGSPRSGTTWLHLMLGAHPSICATTELRLYNKYIAPWLEAWKGEVLLREEGKPYIGLPVLWTEAEFHDFLKSFLERVYMKVLATKPEATHILDKHPNYSEFVEQIHFFIPRARFIHMIRDGRDVAVSLSAASRQMGWFAREPLEDYGAHWKRTVVAAKKASAYTGRYMELRYEDLSLSPLPALRSVFEFCGLPAKDDWLRGIIQEHEFENLKRSRITPAPGIKTPEGHYREGKIGGWRRQFTPTQRYLFDRVAGDLLRELGYAQNGWWAAGLHQRMWVPLAALLRKRPRRGA